MTGPGGETDDAPEPPGGEDPLRLDDEDTRRLNLGDAPRLEGGEAPGGEGDDPEGLKRFLEGDRFEFRLSGGRGFILDFEQGRDVISLEGLGLTPWDLLPSIRGRDLVLSFDGGEVVLRGAAGVHLTQWDFRY